MMLAKTLLLISLSAVTSILRCATVLAQDDERGSMSESGATERRVVSSIGVVVGVDRAYHDGGFRLLTASSGRVFENGAGWGYTAGVSLEIGMGRNSSIVARMAYGSRPGNFQVTYTHAPNFSPVYQGGVEITDVTITAESEVAYALLSAEALYQYMLSVSPGLRLGAAVGPAFGYVLDAKVRQAEALVYPTDARFEGGGYPTTNDGRGLVLFDADIPEHSTTRLSLKGGVLAEIALPGSGWLLSPGVYYDYGLTDVSSSENWNLSALSLQLDLRYAF